MSRNMGLFVVVVIGMISLAGSVKAVDFGMNITIPDDDGISGSSSWYEKSHEDNEVEPRVATGQCYDMEGFFLSGTKLTMVGGYNFWNPPSGMRPGDLFVGIGSILYGDYFNPGTGWDSGERVPNIFGYDYVFDLDFGDNTYELFAIDSHATLRAIENYGLAESNPYRYICGGTSIGEGSLTVWDSAISDAALEGDAFGLSGGWHYAVQLDLAALQLGGDTDFTVHFTESCGNDNLMGRGSFTTPTPPPPTVPDGGSTLALMGLAMLGTAAIRRRFSR